MPPDDPKPLDPVPKEKVRKAPKGSKASAPHVAENDANNAHAGEGGKPEPEESSNGLDRISAHPSMRIFMDDNAMTTDDGTMLVKVVFKPQAKRDSIAVMMTKSTEEGSSWKQRMQIVVKKPLLPVDAMIILKFIATDVLDGRCTDFSELKTKRGDYIQHFADGTVYDAFTYHRPLDDGANLRLEDFMVMVDERFRLEYKLYGYGYLLEGEEEEAGGDLTDP